MNKINLFDVLVVYTESLACSASGVAKNSDTPFLKGSKSESYNDVYGYFLEICEREGLKVAFSTSKDISGPGTCNSYWLYRSKRWIKRDEQCFSSLIFDKFSPTRRNIKSGRKILFSSDEIKSFNDPELFGLFFDKQKTYKELSDYSIPTVSINEKTMEGVSEASELLKEIISKHKGNKDFSEDIVMKDRFGAGGRHIYKFKTEEIEKMRSVVSRNRKLSFIIQPFVKFDEGFVYKNTPASTDIRLIYLNGEVVQTYIRVAKPGDYRCNEHQGGMLTYLTSDEIPAGLVEKSNMIASKLNMNSLYALDFIVSNRGNIYFLEGNAGPGLDWNTSLKKNEFEAKKLIRLVVRELKKRTNIYQGVKHERAGRISFPTPSFSLPDLTLVWK